MAGPAGEGGGPGPGQDGAAPAAQAYRSSSKRITPRPPLQKPRQLWLPAPGFSARWEALTFLCRSAPSSFLFLLLSHWAFKKPENPRGAWRKQQPLESSPRVDVSGFTTSRAGGKQALRLTQQAATSATPAPSPPERRLRGRRGRDEAPRHFWPPAERPLLSARLLSTCGPARSPSPARGRPAAGVRGRAPGPAVRGVGWRSGSARPGSRGAAGPLPGPCPRPPPRRAPAAPRRRQRGPSSKTTEKRDSGRRRPERGGKSRGGGAGWGEAGGRSGGRDSGELRGASARLRPARRPPRPPRPAEVSGPSAWSTHPAGAPRPSARSTPTPRGPPPPRPPALALAPRPAEVRGPSLQEPPARGPLAGAPRVPPAAASPPGLRHPPPSPRRSGGKVRKFAK
uniref:translation initiation factor IF-2-like n=1 Tax=Nyctereutes procyonoides TaxID=34880 RepID=UPI00244476BC|nr:translation initiation factor IF-2-like [Nyctereutes procyonoides]